MSNRKPAAYRVNLKLDRETDADLVGWIEQHAHGARSDAIRQALRVGVGLQPPPRPEGEAIARIVREAIAEALEGLQVVADGQGVALEASEVEEAFGAQLDRLLDRFG